MKRLMILLALVAGMAFAGCSDDEEQVVPKTTAEQIAEQIISFGASSASVYWGENSSYQDIPVEIEVPFFVVTRDEGTPYYLLLENLQYMYFIDSMNRIVLYFE